MQSTAGALPTEIDVLRRAPQAGFAKMPDPRQKDVQLQDRLFRTLTRFFAFLVLAILVGIIVSLVYGSLPAIQKFGFGFLVDSEWNPVTEQFGALVPIFGTLATSFIALLIAVPVSFGIALFLTELSPALAAAARSAPPSSCWPRSRPSSMACGACSFSRRCSQTMCNRG